ncbi:acyltransferase family protein [Adhaeribacter pallidiroseus]|uniref:Acyltransferase 3 domain-containing protein n=1 Tax=Adhaeribacter pallidiroseus TaxID=2072847 RepID=A0A369QPH0_9BACT|nr:acyltransferase [Adhaeribacter pallidiroseus]RDC64108.1 hypothetical protein AHMF7616_02718 [Adhaeribacter pallidiroseus]
MNKRYIHLTGLNGIRAIAAIAVVLSHINLELRIFNLPPVKYLDLAGHGVTMFFALSGFLITYLLMHEKQIDEIDIKKFYLRRVLRIWPLYLLYLFVALFVSYQFNILQRLSLFPLAYYVFFTANIPFILGDVLPFNAHLWSIGVEEQFYLFWPWIIKKTNKNTLNVLIVFIFIYLLLKLLCRFIEYQWGNQYPYLATQVMRFDCMAIGGVGALLFYKNNKTFKRIVYLKAVQILAWVVILLLAFNKFHVVSIIDPEIISVITVIIIVNVSNNPRTLIHLDYTIFNFLGKISYGIYVIHPLVIYLYAKILNIINIHSYIKFVLVYTGVLSFTIWLAYLSFTFFEKKFINLKDKFSVIKSSNIKEVEILKRYR